MPDLKIRIEGAKWTPSWVTLQKALREIYDAPEGLLTRIKRLDGRAGYRQPGEYVLQFCDGKHLDVTVQLDVLEAGAHWTEWLRNRKGADHA